MNIDLHNYETFFLLYVDNELSAAERKAVEEFVDKHEELREEFLQLKDTVLPVENISFPVKKDLYKSRVIEAALQERLLLHLDGELEGKGLEEIEGLIAGNDAVKAEWKILQQTKIEPEVIVFPYKSSLYRRSAKIMYARITRLAIAATIIGWGIFIGLKFRENFKATNEVSNVQPGKVTKKATENEKGQPVPQVSDPLLAGASDPGQEVKKTATINKSQQKNVDKRVQEVDNSKPLVATNQEKVNYKILPSDNNEIASLQINENRPVIETVIEPLIDKNITPVEDKTAMTASLSNSENEGSEDRILYMKQDNITRSKAAAFFRKVKRVVERNTKIKTGDNLSIGGFEIAIK